ncbi:P-loop containing nucleoside triphosphate hydrolase protein [Serendipita vermifera]|nr:P-loop containing nucleoside triphosphate hydrolase protein [Serendipita vermifera]
MVSTVGHGKSTLTSILTKKSSIILFENTSDSQDIANKDGAKNQSITIRSTFQPLHFKVEREVLDSIKQKADGSEFLINLIDTPGHGDFFAEVMAAVRITDGAIVVVDCVEGLCFEAERNLRQLFVERVKPIVVFNKIDRALLETQASKETVFQSLSRLLDSVNYFITIHHDPAFGDLRVSPSLGNVAFGSGLQGWIFTLRQFAARYSKKFGVDREKMVKRLWGKHYFDPGTKKWSTRSTDIAGRPLERAFNMFILDPIFKIFDAILNFNKEATENVIRRLGIDLHPDERDLEGMALLKVVMHKFLPAEEALLEMIVIHLPSPLTAQEYRVQTLYEGPMDDEAAVAIRDCDPNGPLVLYVSKMIPTPEKGSFYAFGRVFAGTLKGGTKVRIQGPNYTHGRKEDLYIESTVLVLGQHMEPNDSPAGNLVGLLGIDKYLLNSGTITTLDTTANIRPMKLTVPPMIKISIDVEDAVDLPKLVDGMKQLSKSDFGIETWVEDSGEHVVAGAGELHLEVRLKELESFYAGIPLKRSNPFVAYRETVRAKSSMVALTRSQNRHNRLYGKAEPIEEELCIAIETGKINARDDFKTRARVLTEQYGWDVTEARKIWTFGPDSTGPNIFVDMTKSVQYLNEIKDSCVAAFQWASKEGVCAEENMRGVRFNLVDVTFMADAIHRGGGQIIPACRRVCYAACLLAQPALQEPISLVEFQCPEDQIGGIYSVLNKRRGQVFSEEEQLGSSMFRIKAYLPMAESFGFTANLVTQTDHKATCHYAFDHWELLPGSALDRGSRVEEIVKSIRIRKGLKPEIPPLDTYRDKF